jgi:RHS repeat-associated protein
VPFRHTRHTSTTRAGQRPTLYDSGGSGTRLSFLYNPHGDVSELLNQNSGLLQNYDYATYGTNNLTKAMSGFDNKMNPFTYSAARWDSGSSTFDMGARRYSPGSERWLQQDLYYGAFTDLGLSTDPMTSNRYLFTGANPVNYVEVDGHRFTLPDCPTDIPCEPMLSIQPPPPPAGDPSTGSPSPPDSTEPAGSMSGSASVAMPASDAITSHNDAQMLPPLHGPPSRWDAGTSHPLRYTYFFASTLLHPWAFYLSLQVSVSGEAGSSWMVEANMEWNTSALTDDMSVLGVFDVETSDGKWSTLCLRRTCTGGAGAQFTIPGNQIGPEVVFGGAIQTIAHTRSPSLSLIGFRYRFGLLNESPAGNAPVTNREVGYRFTGGLGIQATLTCNVGGECRS